MTQNAKPILAWENLLMQDGIALSVSSEVPGGYIGPAAYLQDWRPWLRWTPSDVIAEEGAVIDAGEGNEVAVSCLGISGHDLWTQGAENLRLEWSSNGTDWTNCLSPFTPASDLAIFKTFATITKRFFRLAIPAGAAAPPQIGVLFLGPHIQFPGWPFGPFHPGAFEPQVKQSRSRTGQFLGGVRKYDDLNFDLSFRVPLGWCETYWRPFLEEHAGDPFLLALEPENHPLWTWLMVLDRPKYDPETEANSEKLKFSVRAPREWQ